MIPNKYLNMVVALSFVFMFGAIISIYSLRENVLVSDSNSNDLVAAAAQSGTIPGSLAAPVTVNTSLQNAIPVNGYKVDIRHYMINRNIAYHPLYTCQTSGNRNFINKIVRYFIPSFVGAVVACDDSDTTKVEKGNYDNVGRGNDDSINYPDITSYRYTKGQRGCVYQSDGVRRDDVYESSFPGNTRKTCPEPETIVPTEVPYTTTVPHIGGGTSVWTLLSPNTNDPSSATPVMRITDTISEDSRADLIIDGGDQNSNYIANVVFSVEDIIPLSQANEGTDGWARRPVKCSQLVQTSGASISPEDMDSYVCNAKYSVKGNSITNITPSASSSSYYSYSINSTIDIEPANPTPMIASGNASYVDRSVLANALSALNNQKVTYTGTNFPTDGTAVVFLSNASRFYKITPTVLSGTQFYFVIPTNVIADSYSVQIEGKNTMPSNIVSVTISAGNASVRPIISRINYEPLALTSYVISGSGFSATGNTVSMTYSPLAVKEKASLFSLSIQKVIAAPPSYVYEVSNLTSDGNTIRFSYPPLAPKGRYLVKAKASSGDWSLPFETSNVVTTSNVSSYYSLTVSKSGAGQGSVIGASINCGSICSQTDIPSGTTVTLSATANSNSTFVGWSSNECSGTGDCTFVVNKNTMITAMFSVRSDILNFTSTSGSCSTSLNICNTGTFSDVADSNSSNYLWSCVGLNGGTTALCSSPKPIAMNTVTNPPASNPLSNFINTFRPKYVDYTKPKVYVPPDLSTTTSGVVELTIPSESEIFQSVISSIFTSIKTGVENTKNRFFSIFGF